ncbi:MAG: hypothetical protein IIW72_05245 [Clostridia bacterium]|nr:hypothetical protein [Clostridia bacterium]
MDGVNLVTSALQNVTSSFTTVTEMVTTSELAMVFIGFAIAGAGLGLFRRLVPRSR